MYASLDMFLVKDRLEKDKLELEKETRVFMYTPLVIAFIGLLVFNMGCAKSIQPKKTTLSIEKEDSISLLKKGDYYYNKNPRLIKSVLLSIDYYDGVLQDEKVTPLQKGEANWKLARSYAYLSKYEKSEDKSVSYAKLGMESSRQALNLYKEQNIDNVEALYYNLLNRGLYSKYNKLKGLALLAAMKKDAHMVAKQDRELDNAGAYRFLGVLYYKVPGFILADEKSKYIEYFEKACEIAPKYPPNLFYYAAYLQSDGKRRKSLKYVRQLLKIRTMHEDFKGELEYWKKRARKLL